MTRLEWGALATRHTTAPEVCVRARFRWQARRLALQALSGQLGTLTRASAATATDSQGADYSAAHSMPRWEARDGVMGLRLGTDDLTWSCLWRPGVSSWLVDGAEISTRTTSGAGLLYIGNDGATGARWSITSDGSHYRATIHNGTDTETVTLAGVRPAATESARWLLQVQDDGAEWCARVGVSVPAFGILEVTPWSDPIARAATFGTGAKVRLNRVAAAGTQGSVWVREVAEIPALVSIDDILGEL